MVNTRITPTEKAVTTESFSVAELVEELKESGRAVKNDEIGIVLGDIDDSCEAHQAHKARMHDAFVLFLKKNPRFAPLMDYIPCKGSSMPRLFAACSSLEGEDQDQKAVLANEMLVAFSAALKMKKPRNGCPYYQPSSHSQMLRTLLAAMKDRYEWSFTLDKSFNFIGGVSKVTSALYKHRAKEFDSARYAKGDGKKKLSDSDFNLLCIQLRKYDEDNLYEHMQKLAILLGLQTGLRGLEHCKIEVNNIEKDEFDKKHPLASMTYYSLVNMDHKTNKVSTTNPYLDDGNPLKMPVYSNDKWDLCCGGCLERYLDKLHPGQLRLFCKVARKKNRFYNSLIPLGKTGLPNLIKAAGIDAGIQDIESFSGHSLRKQYITMMANDPNVSLAETMQAARHSSVSASLAYQRKCGISETAKFVALSGKEAFEGKSEEKMASKASTTTTTTSSVSTLSTTTAKKESDGRTFNVTINMGGMGN